MSAAAAVCQLPNPLDRFFCAIEAARGRLRLPRADVQTHLELDRALDVPALRRAIACLQRAFPAIVARFDPDRRGGPSWRRADPPPIDEVLRLQPASLARRADEVFAVAASWTMRDEDRQGSAPVRFDLFNELESGCVLVLRYPHMLMDGRGGLLLLSRLSSFFSSGANPEDVDSVGDESRTDFGRLGEVPGALAACWRGLKRRLPWRRTGDASPARGESAERPAYLVPPRFGPPYGSTRAVLRLGTPEEWSQIQASLTRATSPERLPEFLRVSALLAAHELRGTEAADADAYTSLHLVDQRRTRAASPVCRNVFSALRVRWCAADLRQRGASAAGLFRAVQRAFRDRAFADDLDDLRLLAALPYGVLVGQMTSSLGHGRAWLPFGLHRPPTVPFGILGIRRDLAPSFCGATLQRVYAINVPSPISGFVINATIGLDHIDWTISFDDSRMSPGGAAELLDHVREVCRRADG